jgi:hypothetical protein
MLRPHEGKTRTRRKQVCALQKTFGVRVACHRFVSVFQWLVSNGFCFIRLDEWGIRLELLAEDATIDTVT